MEAYKHDADGSHVNDDVEVLDVECGRGCRVIAIRLFDRTVIRTSIE